MLTRNQLLWLLGRALACCLALAFLSLPLTTQFHSPDLAQRITTRQTAPSITPSVAPERVVAPKALAKLSAVVQEPTSKHTATVIFLHGFGDSGAGWALLGEQLGKHLPHVKFIYPNAPALHITIYGTMTPAWYDFLSPSASSINHEQDEKGMLRSRQQVLQIVRDEMETNNIPANRIVIGGFSQGCVLGLLTGLTSEYRFAGIASLSGYLPLPEKIMDMATDANRKTPIFWGHGTADQAVKYEFGEETVEFLQKNNYAVDFHSYKRMGHSTSIEEITDLLAFFKQTIPEQQPVTAKI